MSKKKKSGKGSPLKKALKSCKGKKGESWSKCLNKHGINKK
jgi:hypothetical protein